MSETSKRETLLPDDNGQTNINYELITKLIEIIESQTKLIKLTIDVLSQYINVEDYERMLAKILEGDDVIIN